MMKRVEVGGPVGKTRKNFEQIALKMHEVLLHRSIVSVVSSTWVTLSCGGLKSALSAGA